MLRLLFLLPLAILVSCDNLGLKNDNKPEQKSEQNEEVDVSTAARLAEVSAETRTGVEGCFEIVFPVSLRFSSSTSIVNNWQEVITAVKKAAEKPQLVYPINLVNEQGKIIAANDRTQLRDALSECPKSFKCSGRDHKYYGKDDKKHKKGDKKSVYGRPCFTLVYPISVNYPAGTTKTYTDKISMKNELRAWRLANRASKERPTLKFPLQVKLDNEADAKVVGSKEELKMLKAGCIKGIPKDLKNSKKWYKNWKDWGDWKDKKDWKDWGNWWKSKDSDG